MSTAAPALDAAPRQAEASDVRTPLSRREASALLASVFVVAVCGLTYELIVGTLSTYLFGSSVLHFSVTIGLFMTAMGIGSALSRFVTRRLLRAFVWVELAVGVLGGASALLLYAAYALTPVYHVAMVGLILVIGALIGLEVPLVTRLLGGRTALKDALAGVLSFDYLGALAASLLFPLVLLPTLGLVRTACATGLLNLAVVAGVLAVFRPRLRSWRRLASVTGVAALALTVGFVVATPLTGALEQRLYDAPVIHTAQSAAQRIVLTRHGDDLRLYLNGHLQFSARDEYRYHELLVHPAMAASRSRAEVLVLGGGDGLALREVLKHPDVERVVLVDLDPAVTNLARTHPALSTLNGGAFDDPRVEVVHADALGYVRETTARFGVVLIDLPDPSSEDLAKLYSTTFYRWVADRLAVGGMLAAQATSPYFAREAFWTVAATLDEAGLRTVPYHAYVPSFGDWGFVLASPRPLDAAVLDAPVPDVPLRFLDAEVWDAARTFGADIDRIEVRPSTLDRPHVLDAYRANWQRWN
ncbi:MAG: polyamine aminopropyltransferase [Bacteroidota bacterium]